MREKQDQQERRVALVIAFPGTPTSDEPRRGGIRDALRLGGLWLLGGTLVLASVIAAHASWTLLWKEAPVESVAEAPVEEPAADRQDETSREMILDLVRRHRRTASETWRATLADAIHAEAVQAAIDPLLVASIVAKESSFKSRIVSRKGAVGLMQLRPWVAEDVANRSNVKWNGIETLHSPTLNVRLGIVYYKELVERFDGDTQQALTAYNYGPSRVSRQLRTGRYRGSEYADSILDLYASLSERRDDGIVRTASVRTAAPASRT
jgi:soluble lytic murein transglycosylase-like protein